MAIDVTQLPAPPTSSGIDINSLPVPPGSAFAPLPVSSSGINVADLPAPPKPPDQHPSSEPLSDQEFQEIADKHGVNASDLKAVAPYYGVTPQSSGGAGSALGFGAKYTAGSAGRMALGVPQFIYKKLQDAPMRRAIDELSDIGSAQRSPVESGAEMVALPFSAAKEGEAAVTGLKAVGKRIAHATGVGAGIGAVNAHEGEELQGAEHGAAFGSVLGAGGELLGGLLRTTVGESAFRNAELKLQQEVDNLSSKTQQSEQAIQDSVLGGKDIAPEHADTVVREQINPDVAADAHNPESEVGDFVKDQGVTNPLDQAQQVADNRATQFAKAITGHTLDGAEARNEIQNVMSREGEQAVRDSYNAFVRKEQALRVIDEQGSRITGKTGALGKLANFFSGNQQVLRHLDNKFGLAGDLSAEGALQKATDRNNQMSYALVHFRHALDDIDQTAEKLGVRNSENLYRALDTGDLSGLSPAEQKVAGMFRNYFNGVLDFSNGASTAANEHLHEGVAPLNIRPQVNAEGQEAYVPHTLKDANKLIVEANQKMDQVLNDISGQLGRKITDINQLSGAEYKEALANNQNLHDLKDGLSLFGDVQTHRPSDFSAAFKDRFTSRKGYSAIETAARAAQERSGGIPMWMREQDPFKLAAKSTMNSLRHLYMRHPVEQLQNVADVMEKAGGDYEARYLRRIGEDYLGTRSSTFNVPQFTNQARIDFMRSMDRAIQRFGEDSPQGKALEAAKAVPDVLSSWARSIFPNVLGYRIRPLMMHATQATTKLWPELGTTPYGAYTVLRGATKAALNASELISYSEKLGTMPAEELMRRSSALRTGMERSFLYKVPANAVNAINNAGMFAFEKLVRFNRAVATGTAQVMAEDLLAGSQHAQSSLSRFPQFVQNAVNAAGTVEEKTAPIAKYLNAQTMYNFDKLNKSEFGRTMGPLFSAFSTWPTNTLGDIVYEMRSRGVVGSIPRQFERYIAPWALLYGVDRAIRAGSHGEMTDREKVAFGQAGISSMAPVGALGALAKGDALVPPVYKIVMETLIHPIMSGEYDKGKGKAYKGLANALASYGPNAGLVQFVTDQVPTLLSGHRPEGNNFIERTGEGARILGKKVNK